MKLKNQVDQNRLIEEKMNMARELDDERKAKARRKRKNEIALNRAIKSYMNKDASYQASFGQEEQPKSSTGDLLGQGQPDQGQPDQSAQIVNPEDLARGWAKLIQFHGGEIGDINEFANQVSNMDKLMKLRYQESRRGTLEKQEMEDRKRKIDLDNAKLSTNKARKKYYDAQTRAANELANQRKNTPAGPAQKPDKPFDSAELKDMTKVFTDMVYEFQVPPEAANAALKKYVDLRKQGKKADEAFVKAISEERATPFLSPKDQAEKSKNDGFWGWVKSFVGMEEKDQSVEDQLLKNIYDGYNKQYGN